MICDECGGEHVQCWSAGKRVYAHCPDCGLMWVQLVPNTPDEAREPVEVTR